MFSDFDAGLFFKAVGLAFFLEGVLWAASPGAMKRAMAELLRRDDQSVRAVGLCGMGLGLLVCWFFS